MVPSGWGLKTLVELTNEKLAYGANAPSCELSSNGLRYIRITDIDDQGNLNSNAVGINVDAGIAYQLKDYDFLFARSGNTVGKTFLFEEALHPPSAYAGYLIRYRPDSTQLSPKYLKQFCFSSRYKFWVKSQIRAGAQPNINAKEYGSMELPLPPLPEQHKIAKTLSTWDKAISITEHLIDNSKQQKKALMQQMLTGKKRLLDDSGKPFEGKWEKLTVGTVATLTAGGTPSTKHPEYWGGDIPWMNSGEINHKQVYSVEGRITQLGLNKSSTKEIPLNSILIALAGQGKTRGTVAINRVKLCTNQSIAAIMPNEQKLDSEFLYFNLDSRYKELRTMSTGDGGRGGLNLSILKSVKLKLPTIEEQQKIAVVLSNADKEIELLEQQLDDLKQEKKALMQQLLTGKRRVKI